VLYNNEISDGKRHTQTSRDPSRAAAIRACLHMTYHTYQRVYVQCICMRHCVYFFVSGACPNNSFPGHLIGDWYSIDQGKELQTEISADQFSNELIDDGGCYDLSMIEGSMDAQGNYDAKILIYNR